MKKEPVYTTDWFSGNIPQWTKDLAHLKDQPNIRGLEVGVFEGRSTCWLLENVFTHPSSSLLCVDAFAFIGQGVDENEHDMGAVKTRFFDNIEAVSGWERVELIAQASARALRMISSHTGPVFDFVYIDGSHLAPNVLEDSVLAWPMLKPGGILTWDDFGWAVAPDPLDRPAPGISAFLNVHARQLEVLRAQWQVTIRKR